MLNLKIIVTIFATLFSAANFFLNIYLLISIFWFKKAPVKRNFALIYCKFLVDIFFSADTSIYIGYFLIRLFEPSILIKNLPFYIALPNCSLSTVRCWLAFFIALDRVLATCTPISYHNHRSKVPLLALVFFILSYSAFENYILFGYCGYVLDVPLNCTIFQCAVGTCYYEYWKWYQQVIYISIEVLSVILFFRLFIWHSCSGSLNNKPISRATRISLLDSFTIIAFDFFPVFLSTHLPEFNTNTLGPVTALCKCLGYVIESTVICHVLLGSKKVSPESKTSPSNVRKIGDRTVVL